MDTLYEIANLSPVIYFPAVILSAVGLTIGLSVWAERRNRSTNVERPYQHHTKLDLGRFDIQSRNQ